MAHGVDVAVLPAEAAAIEADCYVVVDVLRATTTIATLFHFGLRDLVVTGDIDRARATAKSDGRLLFGEVGGLPPEGFDYGNSPLDVHHAGVQDRGAVLFTTNGTLALCGVAGRGVVLSGSLSNAGAVAARAAHYDRIAIVCAGLESGRRLAIEDLAAAGILIHRLQRLQPGIELSDSAGLALTLPGYEDWLAGGLPQATARSTRLMAGSRHGRHLASIGLVADIQYAVEEDRSLAVPVIVEHGDGWARLENAGN